MAITRIEDFLRATGSVWAKRSDIANLNITNTDNLVEFNDYVTTKEMARMENEVAKNIIKISSVKSSKVDPILINKLIDKFEAERNEGRKLHIHQRDAVHMVVNYQLSVLTGGPGTGKTTVLSCIAYVLRALKPDISICYVAPTGKAAQRITESTGENASTVHKKMGLNGNEDKLANPFVEDVLFCDESSMLDLFTAFRTFQAVTSHSKVVLVGDVNQLPSVGCGAILRDVIASKVIPTTMLTKTFRQDNSSVLFQNIELIKKGNPNLVEGSDFVLFNQDKKKPIEIAKAITLDYVECVKKYGIDNVCLLIPYRQLSKRTCLTAVQMNDFIQPYVNKSLQRFGHKDAPYVSRIEHQTVFRVGDLVMQLKNREECCNGEIGKVIEAKKEGILVEYADANVFYSEDDFDYLALAYSMTIHKSQGSEYKCVIMCMTDDHEAMLNRNLIYTGVTRAKKECRLYYTPTALKKACETIADSNRFSLLPNKLKALAKAA